ncbi:PREDICTED: piggyBac transposable element-derived protein 4-like [Priapulus caudatus]|uniref:PiggyBac transposable element-derived protein 4-like n=1 Tax=Priapulus caudatus TaxID=37621 RepID=A0ABM1EEU7_PRICU|nr:PREDICTED: piggyBac transposable element-derived protein 4-like [Priapulus caudatus]
MDLVESYTMKRHHVYADNFFSSIKLVEDLKKADTYYCGTIRKNRRGLPNLDGRLERGQSVKKANGNEVIVARWRDKRDVFMISSNNDGSYTQKPRTRFRHDEMIDIPMPVWEVLII